MHDKPIIFSAPMVRALLSGRKSMTRRVLPAGLQTQFDKVGESVLRRHPRQRGIGWDEIKTLWVRETWQDYCPMWDGHWCGHGTREGIIRDHRPVYRADPPETHIRGPEGKQGAPLKWRSPIHMPRWASRLTLAVTDVRVQRLQEISEADAVAEGAPDHAGFCEAFSPGERNLAGETAAETATRLRWAQRWYERVWNDIHGPSAWDANPWVAAISFEIARAAPTLPADTDEAGPTARPGNIERT